MLQPKKPIKAATEEETIDLKKAQQAVIDDMAKREQAALAEFNSFAEEWSKKYNVTLTIPQPYMQVKANS